MKTIIYMVVLAAIGILFIQANPAISGEPKENSKLIGTWTMSHNSTDASGKPCPFVPESMAFFKDHSLTMVNFGDQHLPFKTVLTKEERQVIEKKNPALKGMTILLVKPNPGMDWESTPMVYGYSIVKNELTLTLQGWSPAKFAKKAK